MLHVDDVAHHLIGHYVLIVVRSACFTLPVRGYTV